MRSRLLVLASLLAMALLLWLALPGEAMPPGGGPVARPGSPQQAGPDAARAAAGLQERALRVERVELPVADAPNPGDAGRLPADPRIHGVVLRGASPVGNREVYVFGSLRRGGTIVLATRTSTLGQYDFPVPGAGSYRVSVAWDGLTQVPPLPPARTDPRSEPAEIAAAHKEVEVRDQPVACDLRLPAGSLRITAGDARTRLPLANVEVAMTWASGTDLTGYTDLDGEMLATDLPAGACTVSLALRGYRAPPPFLVDTGTACPEELQLMLEPACVLELRVCDERGRLIHAEDAPAVEVVHAVSGAVSAPRRFRSRCGSRQPPELQFDNLEEGSYGVRVADVVAEQDGEPTVRFGSAEALASLLVSVAPGRPTTAELRVRWRGYVEILGRTRDRRAPSPTLRVELLDPTSGTRRVLPTPRRSLRGPRPPQFAGYLAEGTYWLTFTGPMGQVHRESLQVAHTGRRHSFQLPW